MARRREAEKRQILPDSKYKDIVLSRFINKIMVQGKKSIAQAIVYGCFDVIKGKDRPGTFGSFSRPLLIM